MRIIISVDNNSMTIPAKPNTYLSKSQFIRGLQCHKSLYLHKYYPELKDVISEQQQKLFQTGIDVGKVAQQLFPGGVLISFNSVPLTDQIRIIVRDDLRSFSRLLFVRSSSMLFWYSSMFFS